MQAHELFWTQTQRRINVSFPVAKFNFECVSVGQNFDNSTNLAPPKIVFG